FQPCHVEYDDVDVVVVVVVDVVVDDEDIMCILEAMLEGYHHLGLPRGTLLFLFGQHLNSSLVKMNHTP
ncbi:hypothetical protein L195_g038081, partial [Trifolium pratense]